MITQFINGSLNGKMRWQIFQAVFLTCNAVALFLYALLHFIFFDFPFDTGNEIIVVLKLCLVSSSFAVTLSLLVLLADATELFILRKKKLVVPPHIKLVSLALILLNVILNACNAPVSAGIKKDFNTGLTATYTAIEPEKVLLIMNNEVINHTDIPLGESFVLVNDNIKGLQVKNGKVTVGCSLSIADQSGKILLNEKDLFAGHDEFTEADAKMLKCTVSTGAPMKWEEHYNVIVTFWDKNGNGKIENKVTIRSIDIP